MAEVVRYVNVGSTAGGDGTTNATAGANRAYATLSEWETNEQTNLVSAGDTHIVYCTGGQDSTAVLIDGWTTGASNYITVSNNTTDDDAGGIFDSAKYFLDKGTGSGGIVTVNSDNVKFSKVQFRRDGPTSGSLSRSCVLIQAQASGNTHDYNDCIFLSIAPTATAQKAGIVVTDSDTVLTTKNCVFYDFDDTNDDGISINSQSAGSADLINNTFQNCTVGVTGLSNTKIKNNVFQDCGTDVSGTVDTTNSGYNLSDASSGLPGSNNVHSSTLTFNNKASDDFHLASGDTSAIGAGHGPSSDSDVPSTDVDGDARSGTTCDIGFDEYVSVGGATNPKGPLGMPIFGPLGGPV